MRGFFRFFIRLFAFIQKELAEVLRQTRLIFVLVLGPFLILLIFGIGYRTEARPLRAIFISQADQELNAAIEEYAPNLGAQLVYLGLSTSENEALEKLRQGQTDIVVVVPPSPYETLRGNQQAIFKLYHNEIDPFQASYVRYVGVVYVQETNRRLWVAALQQGQKEAATVEENLRAAQASAVAARAALQAGDTSTARQRKQELDHSLTALSLGMGASLALLGNLPQAGANGPGGATQPPPSDTILAAWKAVQESSTNLASYQEDSQDHTREIQEIANLEENLTTLEGQLQEFQQMDANIMTSPFNVETKNLSAIDLTPIDFFTPSILALLLQHLAVTFAALSIVRERLSGAMELFRVSPVSALETLLGKYLSYLLFGGLIAASLSLLIVYVLKIPMLGNWWTYGLVIGLLLFASLGFGFVLSLLSQSTSQAVQYSMLLLLTSIYFSGFFVDLRYFWPPVQIVSWSLPSTYGSQLLQAILLRGQFPPLVLVGGILAFGAALFLLSWYLLHRLMRYS